MVNLAQTINDIKSLKIQGATNVARAALETLKDIPDNQVESAINQLLQTRPTEPLLQNCLRLIKLQGKEMIEATLDKLDQLGKLVIENGQGLIKDGMTILTHCHSKTVVETLRVSKSKGLKFKVYLTETRPLMQGHKTAEELVAAGIEATMVTDSEAAMLVSREDQIKIDLVFLGADALTSKGIYNKAGSYGIALSAQKAKVPVYILAKLLKYAVKPVKIEERPEDEIWQEKPEGLKLYNPAFDFVPAELITGVVTEFGILKPEKLEQTVKKSYPWIMEKHNAKSTMQNDVIARKEPEAIDEAISIQSNSGIATSFTTFTPRNDGEFPAKRSENIQNFVPPYKHYLHLAEKVDKTKNLLATFSLKVVEGEDFLQTAGGLGAESSVGTWTEVKTEFVKVWEALHARIIEADKTSGLVRIAYPLNLFEPGNIPQLLSSVAGNIYGLKEIKSLKLLDLDFPEIYVKSFLGPALGIGGIREISGVFNRPLLGSIIKPKLGLSYQEHAKVAKEVFEGGLDFVKDDENLTSQTFNPFKKRVEEVIKVCFNDINHCSKKIYAFNVTAETETMLERAKFIKEKGGNCAMIDLLTAGFSGLQSLRNQNLGLILHGHRAMHAALTRDPKRGLSMLVLAKLARLAGIDSLHTGTVVGKMEGSQKEVLEINDFLLSEWYGLKEVLPVASGGLYPNLIPALIKILGKDILLNFGGGIHGHPDGSRAGATAVVQAVKAVQQEKTLEEYAKSHEELKVAINHWSN